MLELHLVQNTHLVNPAVTPGNHQGPHLLTTWPSHINEDGPGAWQVPGDFSNQLHPTPPPPSCQGRQSWGPTAQMAPTGKSWAQGRSGALRQAEGFSDVSEEGTQGAKSANQTGPTTQSPSRSCEKQTLICVQGNPWRA